MKVRHSNRCDLYISALEPSGDLHGAEILKQLYPYALNIQGAGGPKMRKQGFTAHFFAEDFNIMGFLDVAKAFPKLFRLFKQTLSTILQLNPKVVFLIDYPGFHLQLAKSLRKKGFTGKIVQYVCPSVWAWKKNRIYTIADNYDVLLTLFPFEPKYFEGLNIKTRFVGHPLVKNISHHVLHKPKEEDLIAIFPGSRKKEILRNLPKQIKACAGLKKLYPSIKVAICAYDPAIEKLIKKLNSENYAIVPHEKIYSLMQKASLAIATSGTVTLELALHATPTIVTYGISRLDQFIATKLLKIDLPFCSIANIILNRPLFPELIGTNLTTFNLLKELSLLYENIERRPSLSDFFELKEKLTSLDAPYESSQEIIHLL